MKYWLNPEMASWRWCNLCARWVIKLNSFFYNPETWSCRQNNKATDTKTHAKYSADKAPGWFPWICFVYAVLSVELHWFSTYCWGEKLRFSEVAQDFKLLFGLVMSIFVANMICSCCFKVVVVVFFCNAFVSAAWNACGNEHKTVMIPHRFISQTLGSFRT